MLDKACKGCIYDIPDNSIKEPCTGCKPSSWDETFYIPTLEKLEEDCSGKV